MQYERLVEGMKRFGSTCQDICRHGLGVDIECVRENVVVAPWWEPSSFPRLGEAQLLHSSTSKLWNVQGDGVEMTYVKTGIGAPQFMDSLLALGVTHCKRIVFVGSAGSLDAAMDIGDIVIPEYSVCGDGASRYLTPDLTHDAFGEKTYPDPTMLERTKCETSRVCEKYNAKWHVGRVFSTDTIFAQFAHLDAIMGMGCNAIEMETAAAFRAARLMDIPMAALLSVSDNSVANKSLVSGVTQQDHDYRHLVRREVFPEIILSLFEGEK